MKNQNQTNLDAALVNAANLAETCAQSLRHALSALPETGTCANLAAAQLLAHIETAAKLAAALRNAPEGEERGEPEPDAAEPLARIGQYLGGREVMP